jgi:hypothetical protein
MTGDNDGMQRRASGRLAVEIEVALRRGRGNPVAAHTLDLGSGGMLVASPRPLAVDEVLHFDLDLPSPPGSHLDGRARVVREHAGNVYGLRLEGLRDDTVSVLSRFVATG